MGLLNELCLPCLCHCNDVVTEERAALLLMRVLSPRKIKIHKDLSIMLVMIVPANAVTRKTVTAQRMPVRSKITAAR